MTAKMTQAEYRALVANDMLEEALLRQVRTLAVGLGWIVYHTHDSRRSEPGFPDLVLISPQQGRILFRELKTMRGRPSAAQRIWLDALQTAGQDAGIWRPDDLVHERILDELLPPTRTTDTGRTTT